MGWILLFNVVAVEGMTVEARGTRHAKIQPTLTDDVREMTPEITRSMHVSASQLCAAIV